MRVAPFNLLADMISQMTLYYAGPSTKVCKAKPYCFLKDYLSPSTVVRKAPMLFGLFTGGSHE